MFARIEQLKTSDMIYLTMLNNDLAMVKKLVQI